MVNIVLRVINAPFIAGQLVNHSTRRIWSWSQMTRTYLETACESNYAGRHDSAM